VASSRVQPVYFTFARFCSVESSPQSSPVPTSKSVNVQLRTETNSNCESATPFESSSIFILLRENSEKSCKHSKFISLRAKRVGSALACLQHLSVVACLRLQRDQYAGSWLEEVTLTRLNIFVHRLQGSNVSSLSANVSPAHEYR
jgi:hypothetical protein